MHHGTITHYNIHRSFGFIRSEPDFQGGIFFGARHVQLPPGEVPHVGDEVSFDVDTDRQGRPVAVNVAFQKRVAPPDPPPEPWIDHPGNGQSRQRQRYLTVDMRADQPDEHRSRREMRRMAERVFRIPGELDVTLRPATDCQLTSASCASTYCRGVGSALLQAAFAAETGELLSLLPGCEEIRAGNRLE